MSPKTGPGSPPMATRFRKGQSGNPKGRPKGTKANKPASAFDVIIDRTLTVTRSGVQRELTIEEALQHKTLQEALAGNRAPRREVLKMIEKREKALAKTSDTGAEPKGFRLDGADPRNADDALLILGIASRKPADSRYSQDDLQIEPWAVQAALCRRRGGSRLTDDEIKEVKSHTRDPESLRWPRGTKG